MLAGAIAAGCLLGMPAAAAAAPPPGAYGDNDAGGFLNILPPGQGQSVNGGRDRRLPRHAASARRTTPTSCRCTRTWSTRRPG